jgi:hypothetical protein
MITIDKTLPIGVEYDGRLHTALKIRPRLVKDIIAATGDPLFLADKNNYEICCLAGQIVALGEMPREAITAAMIAEMYEDDFDALAEAAEQARKRVASFRDTKKD